MLLASLSPLAMLGNGMVFVAIIGCGLYCWGRGLFRASILGFAVLGAFVGALATAELTAAFLTTFEVSGNHASWMAYLGTLALLLYGSLAAAEAFASREMWFSDGFVSRIVAAAVGCVSGLILAGALLVGWTMLPLPPEGQIDSKQLSLDAGRYAIEVFSKCVERDPVSRQKLLGGCEEQSERKPCCSEPFADHNANCMRDEDEPYLDYDGNGVFTLWMTCPQSRSQKEPTEGWAYGLLDYYRLGSWETPVCLYSPRVTSTAEVECDAADVMAGVLYQVTAEDANGCDQDQLRYELTPIEPKVAGIIIDEMSGAVTLSEHEIGLRRPRYRFAISVTDRAGLTSELPVLVKIRHPEDANNSK